MKNNSQYAEYYELLKLFSYGTYLDYVGKLIDKIYLEF